MGVNDTKKCRIVPKKNRFVPDLLLHNQRIEEETTMEINKAEIARAMSLADVYAVGEDGSEVLLTPFNFFLKEEEKETDDVDKKEEKPVTPSTPDNKESETESDQNETEAE